MNETIKTRYTIERRLPDRASWAPVREYPPLVSEAAAIMEAKAFSEGSLIPCRVVETTQKVIWQSDEGMTESC